MTLCYSRDLYVEFVPRADLETFIRCRIRAFVLMLTLSDRYLL